MELQNPFIICFTSLLFLFVLFKSINKRLSSSKNSTTKLPPGPWKLPIIGNLHQFLGPIPHIRLRNLAAKYGPLMHLKLGEVSHIIVTSPEMAKSMIKTHDLNLSDRPQTIFAKTVSYNGKSIVFSQYGDYWRQLRKICTIELLTAKRAQSFRSIREEEVSTLIKTLCESEGSIVNLSEMISSFTYGITARAAFGAKNRNQQVFMSAMEEIMHLAIAGGPCLADFYPSIRVLEKMSRTKVEYERLHRETDRILQDILDDHKNKKRSDINYEAEEDLVDILLRLQQDMDLQHPLTDDNIKAIIQDIFGAGGETTSGVVEWGMSEMMKNPKVMEEAQAEVRKVYATKGYVDESELHQLIYLKSVIKETLRLHPPAPLSVPRETRETCKINGYEVPAKSTVLFNLWAIGRDPEYWNEAESFKPERFLNSSIDYKGTHFEYIPFGVGRRMCPGISFAIPNIELLLAKLLYHFDWKLPYGIKHEEFDMTEAFGITVKREHGLHLIPIIHHHP
ncbi:hypothetical protein RIF29_18080 [Crotalaria pallida]|uniref:Cytochrome P450 n=1 Tax=Crotalaria pallida TaxID=3830 RepID=A0AAN9FLL5_CROPI